MIRRQALRLLFWLVPIAAWGQVRPLTILHSNDLHAHLLPDDQGNGGFSRLATAVRKEKAGCAACLYLNAGDIVQGTPVSTIFKGMPAVDAARHLGFDASTIGNHEFDYGLPRLFEFLKAGRFPVLSANIVDPSGRTITRKPYIIRTVGGIRVAIIGVSMADLIGRRVPVSQAGQWRMLPVVETVRKYAAEVRDRSDIIIVLGHIYDDPEVKGILRDVPDVSVVVAGHNHGAYKEMMQVADRVAVLVNYNADQLGRLDLQVDLKAKKAVSAQWKKIPITADMTPAPDMERVVRKWETKVSGLVDVAIGRSTAEMKFNDPELRKLVERAMAEETGADFGWIGGGNVREPLHAGPLKARNVWNMLPYDDAIVTGKFRGSALPPTITSRYPVEPDREYTVATVLFTAQNQAAADQLQTKGLEFPGKGPELRDAVISWIRKKGTIP